jgi:hypothetical protein
MRNSTVLYTCNNSGMHSVAAANKYGVVVYECVDAHHAAPTRRARAHHAAPTRRARACSLRPDSPLARPH